MMEVSEGHFAKTWLLDPRAPKVEAPENIQNLHEKMLKVHAGFEDEEAL
jgi:oligopeptide transport system ATP-binding protein